MKAAARREQDYWLSYSDFSAATEEERMAFFRYDSRGGVPPEHNPIMRGKRMHGVTGAMLQEDYGKPWWIGGVYLYRDYAAKGPLGIRSLIEWFGRECVQRWADVA